MVIDWLITQQCPFVLVVFSRENFAVSNLVETVYANEFCGTSSVKLMKFSHNTFYYRRNQFFVVGFHFSKYGIEIGATTGTRIQTT